MYGPPPGPPVGFQVSWYLIVVVHDVRFCPLVYIASGTEFNAPELFVVRKAPNGPAAGSPEF